MGVAVEIDVSKVSNRFGRPVSRHFTRAYQAPEALGHFNVHQVGRMKLVLIPEKAGLNSGAKRCLEKKFQ